MKTAPLRPALLAHGAVIRVPLSSQVQNFAIEHWFGLFRPFGRLDQVPSSYERAADTRPNRTNQRSVAVELGDDLAALDRLDELDLPAPGDVQVQN